MFSAFRNPLRRTYVPLNTIEINKKHLKHNYNYLSKLNKNIRIAPVLKSNAYGHGIQHIAKETDSYDAPFLCVDSLYEAYELQKIGIKTDILIMGFIEPESLNTKKLPFSYAVYTREQIKAIQKYQPHAKIHIFVDTGMHREGIRIDELPHVLRSIQSITALTIDGLMSHFASSENTTHPKTVEQVRKFTEAQTICHDFHIHPRWIHIANSSGILNGSEFNDSLGNVARTGIALYGIDNTTKHSKLKPVLSLKTHIAQVKIIQKGDSVGYDFTYTARDEKKIAILPIGYFDGVDRRLSNKGSVLIHNHPCPILGKISMNITVVDITGVKNISMGDEVIVFSERISNPNSIQNSATLCSTIPYDLLVHLSPTTRRVIV